MSDIISIMDGSYFWIPILILSLFSIFSILIGTILGIRAIAFFFIWNLTILLVTVFTIEYMVDAILSDSSWSRIFTSTKEITYPLILLTLFFGGNLLGISIYLPLRSFLKSKIKENKQIDQSNTLSRVLGGSVGFITFLPMTFLSTNATILFSDNETLNKINDNAIKYLTFNKYEGLGEKQKGFRSLLEFIDEVSNGGDFDKQLANLAELLEGKNNAFSKNAFSKRFKNSLNSFFKVKQLIKLLPEVTNWNSSTKIKKMDTTFLNNQTNVNNFILSIKNNTLNDIFKGISSENKGEFEKVFKENYVSSSALSNNTAKANLDKIFKAFYA